MKIDSRFLAAGGIAACGLLVALFAAPTMAADPDALWKIVHGLCTPDEAATHNPAPCLAVDLDKGYAVLKDRNGATQLLVIPTTRVTGIESPAVLAPASPNYWQSAWQARKLVEKLAHQTIPRDDLALAVNSVDGRSQDQLHIHVDCLRPGVRDALRRGEAQIGPQWSDFDTELAGHRYRVMRLNGAELGQRNPFKLLADDPAARTDMGLETLVVAGMTFADGAPGFVLLSDRADPAANDPGSGETLLDHDCKILNPAG